MEMSIPIQVVELLRKSGVGKRDPKDEFLKGNKILEPFTKRYGVYEVDDEELCHEFVPISCHIRGCFKQFNTVMEFDDHYKSAHRFMCNECRSQLASSHLLNLHVEETHDSFFAAMAEKKPSYSCYEENCKDKFKNPDERRSHCIEVHKFPPNFRYDTSKKAKKKKKTPKNKQKVEKQSMDCDEDPGTSEPKSANVFKGFSFGHSKVKGFSSDRSNSGNDPNRKTILDCENMLVDLKESLPE